MKCNRWACKIGNMAFVGDSTYSASTMYCRQEWKECEKDLMRCLQAIDTFLSKERGLSLTKASLPSSSTVCALSFSSVSPHANGTPGLLVSS